MSERMRVRAFVLFCLLAMLHGVVPWGESYEWWHRPVTACLHRIGLWQQPWSLFAPNPHATISWLTAEIKYFNGETSQWNSPMWPEVAVSEKFLLFRHLNFYSQFRVPQNSQIANDLAAFIRRSQPNPELVKEVRLSRNQFVVLLEEASDFPSRDDTFRLFSSESL